MEDYNGRVICYNDNDRPSPWSVLQKDGLIHFHRTKREVKAVIDSEVIRLEYVSHLIPLELGGSIGQKSLARVTPDLALRQAS